MANILTALSGWSITEASNQPGSTDSATIAGDLRSIQAGVRYIYSQDTIASAATTDLGSKDAGSLTISGTTTITALGTVSAGIRKSCVFSDILTLTHNATSLILPGVANITTAANDRAEFESLGSGNWRCNWYVRASGQPVTSPLSDGDKGDITVSSSGAAWTLDETAITGKTAETAPAIDDLLLLSDTSDSAALNKITIENLLKVINGLAEDTSPDIEADFGLTYDASASAVKKVLLGRLSGMVSGTATSASGTAVDITGFPSWAKLILITYTGVSTNGTSNPMVQIGDSGGIENAGYLSSAAITTTSGLFTTGFGIGASTAAASAFNGISIIALLDAASNTWAFLSIVGYSNAAGVAIGGGSKALSAALDRLRLTMVNGTDTFDAGTLNVLYG